MFLVARPEQFVTGAPCQLVRHLAPKAVRLKIAFELAAVGGIGVFTVKSRDADGGGGQQGRVHEVGNVWNVLHAAGGMGDRDQTVRLAAAVLGAEADDGRDLAALAGEAQADGLEQFLDAPCRIGVSEEQRRVKVVLQRRAIDDLRQVGHELFVAGSAAQHVRAGFAGVEDRRGGHGHRVHAETRLSSLCHW